MVLIRGSNNPHVWGPGYDTPVIVPIYGYLGLTSLRRFLQGHTHTLNWYSIESTVFYPSVFQYYEINSGSKEIQVKILKSPFS